MAYFNHAYQKTFVATFGDQVADADKKEVTDGVLTSVGVHVSELKNTASPYSLGVGVLGFFSAKTNLSDIVGTGGFTDTCCPFYLAGAAIKLNDKQGSFHGGYQESNKSKLINPKYLRKAWCVKGNAASRAVLQLGGTQSNLGGQALTITLGVVGGTGYATATNVPTTSGGAGIGLTVDITVVAGNVTVAAINQPGSGYVPTELVTIVQGGGASDDETLLVDTVSAATACEKEFICGETYYLRVEVKGTAALRFANHNLYQTLQADGGCCADPASPIAVDPSVIYLQWATHIAENPYFADFIRPILVIDGESYAYDADAAVAEGLPAANIFANAPTTTVTSAGLILLGSYVDTAFGDCTFQTTDYYGKEPIQLLASEVDYLGDPCTFEGLCVVETCPGIQANGLGESAVRELILSESYLQNFMSSDLRIREITQGTAAYDVISRTSLYSKFYILHSVPRFNNPTGVFDNDQYLLAIIGTADTADYLVAQFGELIAACGPACEAPECYETTVCNFTLPDQP